jgi:hypothetical protein
MGLSALVHDRPHVPAFERRRDALRHAAVDDLEAVEQAGVVQEVQDDRLEGQGLETPLPQLRDGDLGDELRFRMELGIGLLEAVDVFHQGEALAAEALG